MTEMNAYDKKVKEAETIIKVSILLRLSGIAILALFLAASYAYPGYIIKMYNHSSRLFIIIPVFALEFFLTLKWLSSPKLLKLHLILYSFLGGVFNVIYLTDALNLGSSSAYGMLAAVAAAVPVWIYGMISLIIAKVGDNSLAKAEAEQRYWKEKAEREQARSGDDKNE